MKTLLALSLLLLVACAKDSTGPVRHDPVLLIRNTDQGQSYTFTWRDGQGIVGASVLINTPGTFCEHFDAQPDSAYYEFVRTDSTNGWHIYQSNWFDPIARPTWTVDTYVEGSHLIVVRDTTDVPC